MVFEGAKLMTMRWVVQVVETAKTIADADKMLQCLRLQDGFISGRTIGDGHTKPFAVQAFFEDCGRVDWLPDGMRRVLAPERMLVR